MSRRGAVVLLAVLLSLGATALGAGTSAAGPTAADRARVVRGTDSHLFIAQDWTVACQDAGRGLRVATAARDLAA
ncbi:MAG: hypothetical protein JWN08_1253, partial [Frankiales bacterium]|nr:hypothetical protein [Frankiales bacterium]